MRVYLIRHGESEGNKAGVLQGRQDWPLTDRGREQAAIAGRFLAEDLGNHSATHLFASPLSRAAETAAIIRGLLPHPIPEPVHHDSLREIHCGALEGLPLTEIPERFPGFAWPRTDWLDLQHYGGQSREEFFGEVYTWLEALALPWEEPQDGAIVFVSHAATLRALVAFFLDQRDFHHLHYHFGNACLLRLGMRRSDQGARPALEFMLTNDQMALVNAGRRVAAATSAPAGDS
ncbi:MAG TPA: histidine phosphatase family protein [bacterium]|nr:histidine phosphatase family protein [bacterium]